MANKTTIIGATTWGTTLALTLAAEGRPVTLLTRTPGEAAQLETARQNPRFLPGIPFPPSLQVTADPAEALNRAALALIAVPSHRMRQNAQRIRNHLPPDTVTVSAAKGLELPAALRMTQVLAEELPAALRPAICALSGPNLAKEIAQGKPASTVIAGTTPEAAQQAQAALLSPRFRVYTSTDLTGVELGGALKNIVALGAGICDGLDFGENAKAAFITRGLAEITRLGLAAGAQPLTFAGLAGLGDVIATCASRLSRNRCVGEQLARGRPWPQIQTTMNHVAEGVNATQAALIIAARLKVEMPIAQTTNQILHHNLPPQAAAAQLMERPPTTEW